MFSGERVMATSSSGCSCDAPADFNLSSSTEDSGSRLSLSLEKCPLCKNSRKIFYCRQCIQNGDFFHSNHHHYAERFAEKQLQLLRLKSDVRYCEASCEELLARHGAAKQMKSEIYSCHERLRLLHMLIKERKQQSTKRKPIAIWLQQENKKRLDRLPNYKSLVEEKAARVRQMRRERDANKLKLDRVQDKLKTVIRSNVQQLVSYIFPISVVEPVEPLRDREQDTVSALADASRTAYVRGHWVLTDSSGELYHCIVAPTLPGSGDYSAYSIWHAANKDAGMSGVDNVDCNPAYNIAAGLTFTTQLVNILAFYTDLRLPHKLSYADFCGHEMGEHTFARHVAKLNCNVLHLCFSQNVRPEQLQPTRTLQNVLVLLDPEISDLGRQGPLEVDPQLAHRLEEQLTCDLDLSEDSGSESDDNFPQEWEAVPNVSCPEMSAGPAVSVPAQQQQQLANTQQSASMMSSALNTITSLWRGWAAHR